MVVTTFPELTDRLATELGVAADVLPPPLARVVLETVARQRHPVLAERRGLVREAYDVIEELESAHLSAGDTRAIAHALGTDSEGAQRLSEIADLFEGYEEALARLGLVDRHGRTRAVTEALAAVTDAGRRPPFLHGIRRIVFAEIYDYSVLQFLLATSLIRLIGDAELVAFAHPENVEATRFLDRTWNRFVGAEPIADQVLPSFVRRDGRRGGVAALLRGVFASDPPAPPPNDGTVHAIVAPHRYGEVEAVMRAIGRHVRGGVRPERIGVLARDMALYRDAVLDVSRRFGIPVEVRRAGGLLAAGVVRFVLDLWRLAADGLPRVALGSALDSDYVRGRPGRMGRLLARVGYVREDVAPVEACLEAATRAGRRVGGEARVRRSVALLRQLGRGRRVRTHVRAMRRTLRALGFRAVDRERRHPDVAARDAGAVAALEDALLELAALDRQLGLGEVGPREMADLVSTVLADWPVPTRDPARRGVRAFSVQDARGLDFDVVYVLGLDDGTFPRPHRESVLLPDWLRRQMNPVAAAVLRERLGARAGGLPLGALLRTAREAQLEDPFLFFLAVSMAVREIVLVRPASDGAGTPCVRSPYVDEVAACFSDGLPTSEVPAAELVPPPEDCAEPRELLARVALDRWRGDADGARRYAAAMVARMPAMAERLASIDRRVEIERRRTRYFLTPGVAHGPRAALADAMVGRIDAAPGLAGMLTERAWSVSGIERLAACGFKFFAADVLGLREPDRPAADPDAREAGALLHAALEMVLGRAELPGDAAARHAVIRRELAARRDELMAKVPPKHVHAADVAWSRVVGAVVEIADLEWERRAAWAGRPHACETEWGFELVAPEGAAPPRRVQGRIDLVDVVRDPSTAAELVVTDFKSSRNRGALTSLLDPSRAMGVTAFQIPVYLAAAAALLTREHPPERMTGRLVAAYAPVGQKVATATFAPPVVDGVVETMRGLVDEAVAGRFDVDPRECDEWCAFRTVCRYVRPPTEEEGHG